ncbi:MAG: ATP-binding protein [Bacteroidaceae bacterium]|nr:ATP-binding protein [Bacteroidaceae bacterium]
MEQLKTLPIGIQSFESLRKEEFLYVDKTELIYKMIKGGHYYFLSRPRRFGKSLLMSTIHAVFDGKRELFEGLAIADKSDMDWAKHPVLHLDLNTEKYDSKEKLENKIDVFLSENEDLYGKNANEKTLGTRFEGVIQRAYDKTGKGVVILVDEYDKPMLQAIGNEELQNEFRGTLKGFYGALKSKDACIKFALLTGVTKFGKVSVFSDLNNLEDISMDYEYHNICGLTEEEVTVTLKDYVKVLADANGMTMEECTQKLRTMYDGYHFHPRGCGMYNPFSVLNTFKKKEFGSYWFETGTPTYLVELLQRDEYNLNDMEHAKADADTLNSIDSTSKDPIPVIYQSGYLTIKDYDPEFGEYTLGFPNKEVEMGFTKFLLPWYISKDKSRTAFDIKNFVLDIRSGNTEQFVKRLKALFADTPYMLIRDLENHYQNIIWAVCKLAGFYVQAEYMTSDGRIDLVLQTPKFCYVMEFKLDGTAEEALAQIEDKHYALPFELNGQQVIHIGMNFSKETKNIEKAIIG